jgi:hypothetical protein
MKITFALKFADLQESFKIHQKAEQEPPALSPGSMLAPNAVAVLKPATPVKKSTFSMEMVGWILILVVAIVIFVIFHKDKSAPAAPPAVAPGPAPNLFLTIFLNILPYSLIFFFIWFFFLRQIRKNLITAKQYDNDPFHLQERTVELLETGIRVSLPHERHDFDWMAYQRIVVGETLLLLYTGTQMYQIVPRRAFVSNEQLEEFVRAVQTHVPDRRAGAFPVITGGT